jgi:2-polyprenyl-6-methoxyphenol hydroxylase-like FAD-dependent oxidoreductase
MTAGMTAANGRAPILETPVLIVGGGPVGLAIAADLGWRGIECTLIEQTDGEITNPRIIAENVRSMEFCRRWGISKDVAAAGFPPDYPHDGLYVTSLTGHLIARITRPGHGGGPPTPVSPERAQRCHQGLFDPILRRLADSLPTVRMRYNCAFESFQQDAHGVTSRVRDVVTGWLKEIRSQYVVACCGGRSSIRRTLGIAMEGNPALGYPINIVFRVPELWKLHDKGKSAMCYLIGSDGVWATINSVNGRDLWRISLLLKERKDVADIDVNAVIEKVVGRRFDYEIVSVVSWVQRAIIADRYGDDRVFIAGDCAHQNPPDGGLGMNTGLGDAIDIAWKLAGVLDGWGGSELLASYEADRRPIAQRNVAEALRSIERRNFRNVAGIEGFDAAATETRRRCVEKIERETASFFRTDGVALGYRYENSPICWPDATPAPPDDPEIYVATTRPGHRVPHAWLKSGVSTLDLFGRGFTLMRLGEGAPDPSPLVQAARRKGMPLTVYSSDDPVLHRLYERKLVLVRPDGHAAWRGDAITIDPMMLMKCVCGEPASQPRIEAAAAQAAVNSQWTDQSEGMKPMPVKISESWVSMLRSARADGVACLVATADASGQPLISPKGSVLVFDDQTLAYWERSLRGAKSNLGQNPNVLVY